ncbi:hypothetical protein [Sphingomonas sp. R86520]|uniref:hypothetical protein n=1 Tax=Sphingomonas sp. R86520 TaxID=3093859 RepID=UPI0036D2C162
MAVIGELLFWSRADQASLSDVLRHNLEVEVRQKISQLPAARFDREDDEKMVAALVKEMQCEPIELRLEESDAEVTDISVTVRDVFGDDATVPGLRVVKVVPFDGERDLFGLRPNSWNPNPPRGEVRSGRLLIGMEVRQSQSEEALRYIEETLASVQTCIASQRPMIDEFNRALVETVRSAVISRRQTLGTASDLAARLRGR